jgi:hypothetical protein
MSNQKYTPEQRQEFRQRLAAIELIMPDNYSEIVSEKIQVSKDIVRNVRHGKTINFPVLEALETLCEEVHERLSR